MGLMLQDESKQQPQSSQMPPLDVIDFPVTWPIWRQQFQIYLLAAHDQVPERRKLAIFLNCLGPAGIALATKFFPDLRDFESVAAKEITLDKIWSLFDDFSKPRSDTTFVDSFNFYESIKNWRFHGNLSQAYLELLSAAQKCDFRCHLCQTSYADRVVRDQLMHILPEQEKMILKDQLKLQNPNSQTIISKYFALQKDRRVWPLIFPYLSMCDIEAVSLSSPAMNYIVHWFIKSRGLVQIEQCCLARYCPETSVEFYQKYGAIVRNLKLKNIPESDVGMVIHFFTAVDYFALQDMEILDSVEGFPNQIIALTITNSTMELNLMEKWLSISYYTLESMELDNFVYSCCMGRSIRVQELNLANFANLRALTVKGDVINVRLADFNFPCNLEFLKLSARLKVVNYFIFPKLRYLHYDLEDAYHVNYEFRTANSTLVSLTLRNWVDGMSLDEFEVLEELKITTPVPIRSKRDIESLNIKTTIVEYEPIPEIHEEPNLIFDMLNEYCILEIMDYLSDPDWMTFGQLNSTTERAVVSYKYPRHHLKSHDCRDANILRNVEHCLYISGAVKTFIMDHDRDEALIPYCYFACTMSTLKSLTIKIVPKDMAHRLPDGLEELVLECASESDLLPYFKKLAPTLKVLKIRHCGSNEQCLLELTNLRELCISALNISITVLKKFLELNSDTLEYLNVTINESGWLAYEEVLQTIGSMRNLKGLKISRWVHPSNTTDGLEENCHLVANLFEKIGPQLEKLTMDVYGEEMVAVLDSQELKNLSVIKIYVSAPVTCQALLSLVLTMKNLRKLHLRQSYIYGQKQPMGIPELMSLLEGLPHLTHLSPDWTYVTTIKFRKDLKEYLRQRNRELWIINVKV